MLSQHGKSQSARVHDQPKGRFKPETQKSNQKRNLKGWKVATYPKTKVATKNTKLFVERVKI
jgi:hypothetical protein